MYVTSMSSPQNIPQQELEFISTHLTLFGPFFSPFFHIYGGQNHETLYSDHLFLKVV